MFPIVCNSAWETKVVYFMISKSKVLQNTHQNSKTDSSFVAGEFCTCTVDFKAAGKFKPKDVLRQI